MEMKELKKLIEETPIKIGVKVGAEGKLFGSVSSKQIVDTFFKATGKTLIEIDPRYFRPAEVDLLLGDSSKARAELGWKPKYDLAMLVKEMVEEDLKLAKKEKTLRENGYEVLIPQEV